MNLGLRMLSRRTFVPCALLLTTLGVSVTAQPQRDIRIPDNLPEPVAEEMRVNASELDAALADADVVLLDVREAWELKEFGTREGYLHIPLGELESRLDELPTDKMILTA